MSVSNERCLVSIHFEADAGAATCATSRHGASAAAGKLLSNAGVTRVSTGSLVLTNRPDPPEPPGPPDGRRTSARRARPPAHRMTRVNEQIIDAQVAGSIDGTADARRLGTC